MGLMTWDESLRTGDKTVDAQHQSLFKLVNDLHDAIVAGKAKEALDGTLNALTRYCVEHFRAEESLMQRSGYPAFADHKAKHDELTKKATETVDDFRSGRLVLAISLSQFLADWLKTHIRGEDQKMVAWVRSNI